jgi:hypothetical protein
MYRNIAAAVYSFSRFRLPAKSDSHPMSVTLILDQILVCPRSIRVGLRVGAKCARHLC